MARRPTQKDVAVRAGVSCATVSYIINNRVGGNIRICAETRQRVLDAVRELNYLPDVAAQGLSQQKTWLLGVALPDLTKAFYAQVFRGIQRAAAEAGYDLIVAEVSPVAGDLNAASERMLRRKVDGAIVPAQGLAEETISRLRDAGVKVVVLGAGGKTEGVCQVVWDEEEGVRQMIAHLLSHGHRKVAFAGGAEKDEETRRIRQAFLNSLRELGQTALAGMLSEEDLAAHLEALFQGAEKPTAVFCANGALAMKVIWRLEALGCRVPGDVAVAGFGSCGETAPALTTFDPDPTAVGKAAATCLVEWLKEGADDTARSIHVGGRLVIGETT
ncbi:LacI family DNA-binding transcriptional regulator [Ornatilinea apprima]|uniref:LacI family DNA-binding transcriptional regulator n=1 Tax=Ornatilinea apprima TaxID=1134406 RepID=UPI0009461A32|nr:LacI family DNA-binding transcriptional regulator [Ornatilinea apprima]